MDLLVETNPTGHVQADGFFSRFLLVQQKVQKRMAKRKNVTMSEAVPDADGAAAASPPPAAKPCPSEHLLSSTHGAHAHAEALERSAEAVAGGSPSSPSAKLTQMHHRKEVSWSSLTQPGSNQVQVARRTCCPPCNRTHAHAHVQKVTHAHAHVQKVT